MSVDPEATAPDEPHHPHGSAHDPVLDEVENHVDPAIAETVHGIRDRFGTAGLRDLITLAGYELDVAEQALASLREQVVEGADTHEAPAGGTVGPEAR